MLANLTGKKVAILATDGFEQIELTRPWEALTRAGAKVEIVSPKAYEIQGFNHLEPGEMFAVDKRLDQAKADDYDALVIPGGVFNPDQLRTDDDATHFAKPVRTDLANAGANVVDEEVVVDGHLITSRGPDDLPAFCDRLIRMVAGEPLAAVPEAVAFI